MLHSTHAAVLSLVDALELLSDSPMATRHAAHASLIVAAADDATSTSVNATPGDAFTAECGRSNVPAAPWTIASLVAGVAASVLTQPFDVVKTRMQANLGEGGGGDGGYRRVAAAVFRERGAAGLWLGLLPRALRVVGATFIVSSVDANASAMVATRRATAGS